MKYYSTKKNAPSVELKTAVLKALPPDNGLYMPEKINPFSEEFLNQIEKYSFPELAFETAKTLLKNCIDEQLLKEIIFDAVNFEAPVKMLDEQIGVLELWHGPSLAFKDFGARFMARLMNHFVKNEAQKLHILVATSVDTGGAVALGFYKVPNIEVTILYPSGKVSDYQEKQLTTLGKNINAIEVNGTFDDCQALVKKAFLDEELRNRLLISSANSINISRLIPQMFYYVNAYKQLKKLDKQIYMVVPSGNFGNITAGLFATKMGLPNMKFVAALNANDGFHNYLNTGKFVAKPSVATVSNAMDVGNPSNLARINDLFENDVALIKNWISSYTFTDKDTKNALTEIYSKYNYIADPHGAVAYLAAKTVAQKNPNSVCIFQETAHPSKFMDTVKNALNTEVDIPENLKKLLHREKKSIKMEPNYEAFRAYLDKLA